MPNIPGIYFTEADQIRLQGYSVAPDTRCPPYDSARADLLAQRDRLLAERDAARQSCDMWATKCADQAKELRRADRFRRGTVAIGIVLATWIVGLGLAALLRWV